MPNVSQENFEFTSKWICIICSVKIFPFNHIVSDSQFNECISESVESAPNLTLSDLENKVFNSFQLNDDSDIYMNQFNPDENYYKDTLVDNYECKYYVEETFNT